MKRKYVPGIHDRTPNDSDSGQQTGWLVPYCNMMTILMIFFLTLYAFTYFANDINYERLVTRIQSDFSRLDKRTASKINAKLQETEAASNVDRYIREKGLDKLAKVEINAQKMRILLTSPVLFSSGKAELTDNAMSLLSEVSKLLKQLPNQIVIEGHTDNVPIKTRYYGSNWELSVDRAISVVDYLSAIEGMPPERLAVAGYGEYRPRVPNTSEDNMSMNRRIEIVILRS